MGTRTVRLDAEDERALDEIQRASGMSVSRVLKHGLSLVRGAVRQQAQASPYAVYAGLDLGPGGYAQRAARDAKQTLRRLIARKHGR